MKTKPKLILDHDRFDNHFAGEIFKYYPECPFCGANNDQPDYIQWCVNCRKDLVQDTGNINWLEISKRLLKTLEHADIDSMTLIGVINWVARQPEFKDIKL